MKNQGVVKFFAIAFSIVCLYQLSFTLVAKRIEAKAKDYAQGDKALERRYLDSIGREGVYNLLLKDFTYYEVKEKELNLGLDLQGGMNVVLEVSIPDVVRALSNFSTDPDFNKAIEKAISSQQNSQLDFVSLFVQSFKEVAPSKKLSTIFATRENKDKVNFNSSNEEVETFLRAESEEAINRSFKILSTRIDKFGVAQPNIQKLGNSGRVMVELPGVDNPQRVRDLLQSSAQLEFWNCYTNYEANKFVDIVNTVAKNNQTVIDTNKTVDTTSSLLGQTPTAPNTVIASADSNKVDSTNSGSLLGSTTDTNTGADTNMTAEQFMKENPLYAVLFPAVNEQNMLVEGPVVGYAQIKDTAAVNKFINDAIAKDQLPSDLVFAWAAKPFAKGETTLALYALKSNRDGKPALEGDVIVNADGQIDPLGQWEVSMAMNPEGAKVWRNITAAAAANYPTVKRSVAIVLDGMVYSAPTVQGEIAGGRSSISGNFTQEEAKDLATILKAGKLPAPTRIVEEAVVGPSLGKDAIQKGLTSVILGLIAVIIFMIAVYNSSGWVADIAVFLNLFFIVGVLASLGAALTLPGIAGIILTIGMAVDANVLINERIKEELAAGKNLKNAVSAGYKNALSAILDSNITTLLAGVVLLIFGSGPIYGFAITLIIGIVSSLFTAILITRLIFEARAAKDKKVSFSFPWSENLLRGKNIDFIGKRKIYYAISGIIIAAGIGSLFTRGLDFGVDFKGGWTYVVQFENQVNISDIRSNLEPQFGKAPEVKVFGTNNVVKITTDYLITDQSENASENVEAKLIEGLKSAGKYSIESRNKVGPTIADDIKSDAVMSIVIALIGMFLYILFRFGRWQFALGTVLKLIHDVLIVLSFFSLLKGIVPFTLEIDQAFIAAILTVIGYSINDSVVVFDRIREYLAEKKSGSIASIFNEALNATLSRTLITSVTTIVVVAILFVFGGEVIRGFSFAMLIGFISGNYSSICIGTPLAVDLLPKEKK